VEVSAYHGYAAIGRDIISSAGADYDVHCTAGTVLVNANPVSALVDLVLPEKYKISKTIHGGADEFAAIGESMCRFGIACVNSSDNNITE